MSTRTISTKQRKKGFNDQTGDFVVKSTTTECNTELYS